MDKETLKKAIYTFFRSQKELANFCGYKLSSVQCYINGNVSVPKPLITILRLLTKNKQLHLELQLIKTYYGFPDDMNFKDFLKKVDKFDKTVEKMELNNRKRGV